MATTYTYRKTITDTKLRLQSAGFAPSVVGTSEQRVVTYDAPLSTEDKATHDLVMQDAGYEFVSESTLGVLALARAAGLSEEAARSLYHLQGAGIFGPQVGEEIQGTELEAYQAVAVQKLRKACQQYILAHYDRDQQASLLSLWIQAILLSYPNRINLIGSVLAWLSTIVAHYYAKKDEINAATDEAGVDAVTWDFPTTFDAGDPAVSLRTASEMNS